MYWQPECPFRTVIRPSPEYLRIFTRAAISFNSTCKVNPLRAKDSPSTTSPRALRVLEKVSRHDSSSLMNKYSIGVLENTVVSSVFTLYTDDRESHTDSQGKHGKCPRAGNRK